MPLHKAATVLEVAGDSPCCTWLVADRGNFTGGWELIETKPILWGGLFIIN